MDNSNKPSPSNVQDAGKKEGLAKKMKAAKAPVKMQKSPKKVGLPKNLVNFKKSSKEVTKKSLAKTPTKKSTTSPKGMKTRANSNRGSLDSLMAGFQDCPGDAPQGLVRVCRRLAHLPLQGGQREGPQHHRPRHVSSKILETHLI